MNDGKRCREKRRVKNERRARKRAPQKKRKKVSTKFTQSVIGSTELVSIKRTVAIPVGESHTNIVARRQQNMDFSLTSMS